MKHKCLCSILLILTMLSTCWTYSVAEDSPDTFTSGDYEYIILNDGAVKITKYNGSYWRPCKRWASCRHSVVPRSATTIRSLSRCSKP